MPDSGTISQMRAKGADSRHQQTGNPAPTAQARLHRQACPQGAADPVGSGQKRGDRPAGSDSSCNSPDRCAYRVDSSGVAGTTGLSAATGALARTKAVRAAFLISSTCQLSTRNNCS